MADYAWDSRVFSSKVPATVVGTVIEEIAAVEGDCPPAALVDRARPEGSPLHPLFDWDDAHAAEQHRLAQARKIVRGVRTVNVASEEVQRAPAFVSVRRVVADGSVRQGYVQTQRALADEGMRAQVLWDAFRQLEGLRARYSHLLELDEVWAALDSAKDVRDGEPVA